MIRLQCPHCDKEVELEEAVFGLFDCPYCNKEFEYADDFSNTHITLRPGKVVTTLLVLSVISVIGAGIIYFGESEPIEHEPCEDCSWEEQFAVGLGQGMAEGAAESFSIFLTQVCVGISVALLILAGTIYLIQHMKRLS